MSDMFARNAKMNEGRKISPMGQAAEARRDGVRQPPSTGRGPLLSGFRTCNFANFVDGVDKTSHSSNQDVGMPNEYQLFVVRNGQMYPIGWNGKELKVGKERNVRDKRSKKNVFKKSKKSYSLPFPVESSSEEEESCEEEESSGDKKALLSDFLHEHCTKPMLKNMAAKADLPQTGTKDELIERLTEHYESPF